MDSSWNQRLPQVFAALASTVGVFAFGAAIGWASPAVPSLEQLQPFELSVQTKAWIGSIVLLGAAFSCPVAGFLADNVGRKRTMVLMGLPFIAGWLLVALADSALILQLGRFITGFCGGTYSVTVPMYISEISDSEIRGRLVGFFPLAIMLGILFSYCVGSFVDWFVLSLVCSILPLMLIVLMVCMPESPHFLLRSGKIVEASRRLCWLRSAGFSINVDAELRQIQRSLIEGQGLRKPTFKDFFTKQVLKPTALCLMLMVLQQMSGVNAIIFFAHDIFVYAGEHVDSNTGAIAIAVVFVIGSAIFSTFVDRSGRRILMLISQIVVVLALTLLGMYFYLQTFGHEYTGQVAWVPLLSLAIFALAFSVGLNPLSWLLMGELLSQNFKGLTTAMTAMLSWVLAFVVTQYFEQLILLIGPALCFWLFAITSCTGILFTFFLLPETRGKTLEEIQQAFFK